jgi:hypothetical protein
MVYRDLQDTQLTMEALHAHLRAALLANNTRDAIGHAGAAQEAAAVVLRKLEQALRSSDNRGSALRDANPDMLRAAHSSMSIAVEAGERVALGTNIDQMRDRLIDFKTQVDYADAYLRVSLGAEQS